MESCITNIATTVRHVEPTKTTEHSPTLLTKNAERREKFRKIGQALSAYDQAWAERRGELINQEYRGRKSQDEHRVGPRTLQIVELYNRTKGRRRPNTIEEDEELRLEAEARWELVKELAQARSQHD